MKDRYIDLIDQTYFFPQEGFDLRNEFLTFHGLSLKHLIETYGTPFKLTYLPRIGEQIKKAKNHFSRAIKKHGYKGKYHYAYCTKCCHFSHVITEALKHDVHLETSSSFDIDLIRKLHEKKKLSKDKFLIHNGYKTDDYLRKIIALQEDGFENSIIILDSKEELSRLKSMTKRKMEIGLRMSINEEPQSSYYTSRLGIPPDEIIPFYEEQIANDEQFELKMMHFFVDSGIKDTLYYWGEFRKGIMTYATLKGKSESLDSINIGGGLPIRNNLGFEYDYGYLIGEIVGNLKEICMEFEIPDPHLFTEFGKYTVGEAGAVIFQVLEQKKQNDSEVWYMVDNSLMNTIPDSWGIYEKFILLPVNKWNNRYVNANVGGLSCDHSDYYNSEDMNQQIFLPVVEEKSTDPLYIGFFHTGAYQDAISGYGGIKHCLIPSPKHIVIDRDETGNFVHHVYRAEQKVEDMLNILGYNIHEDQ